MIVSSAKLSQIQERVLVLAPSSDADPSDRLRAAGIAAEPCADVEALCRCIREGGGAAIIAEECLAPGSVEALSRTLSELPRWADFPIILLAPRAPEGDGPPSPFGDLGPPGMVIILERPVPQATLVTTVHAALRSRRRQYELRDHLAERQRQERALRESKERYRQLVESSPDAILAASVDGRIVYANSAVMGFLGAADLGGVIGASFLDRLDPGDRPGIVRRLRRAARATGRDAPVECRWMRPDGHACTVELALSPLPWEGAATVQIVVRDVSARHRSDERLRALASLSDSFRDLEDPDAVMGAAAQAVLDLLGVARVVFADVDPEHKTITRAAARGKPPATGSPTFGLDILGSPGAALLERGITLAVHDINADDRLDGSASQLAALGVRAGICAPVIGHGRLVAFLAAYERAPRTWTADEVGFVEEVGRRTWLAVERARALARLRDSESSLRALTESLPQIIWSAAPDGVPDFFNQRWYEYTGLGVGEEDRRNWPSVVHEEDRERTVALWSEAVSTGGEFDLEHRIRRADGTYRWYLTRAFPVRDEHGRITRWFGSGTDIDDHKRLEDALRRSEQEYRATFELAAVGKSHTDPATGRLLKVNRKLCEITGYSESELLGRTFFDITHPDDRGRNREEYERLVRGEIGEFTIEKRYICKDGSAIWVLVNSAMVRDADGRALRCVSVILDTTRRRRAEEALRRSEQHLRDVLDSLEVAVGVLHPDGTIVEVNRDTLQATGMEAEDVVGRRLDDLPWFGYSEEARAQLRAAIDRAASGRSVRYDAVAQAGGQEFILDLSIAPMMEGGKVAFLVPSAIDITRRKQAEAALRDSERRHRELAEALPQLVWTGDADGATDYVNARYTSFAGLTLEQLAGSGWLSIVHPDDLDRVQRAWDDAVHGRAPYDLEYRIRRADGEYRWFQIRGVPVRDARGGIVKWFGTCTDIHERREAAEALRRSEERYRLVIRATNDAVWDWDIPSGRIEWGEALRTLFGYSPEDVRNTIQWWEELVHPDDRGRVTESLDTVISGRADHWNDEYRFRRADGSYAHILDRGYAIRDHHGAAVRFIGAMLDVSDRKEAEESLRASEARFRQLADSMPQIVWSATADGRVDYCNRRWYEFAGSPPSESDDPWREVIHPDDALAHSVRWHDSVRTGKPFQHEYRLREAASGQYRWHLGRAVPILDEHGAPVRWFGSSTNIDDQKLAQHRLSELVDELNRSNRELEDFAHIASHDLKEPLRGIRNYSSFLIEDYADTLDSEGLRKLRTIDRLGKRMDDLISSLLYYSQVGRTEMAIENTDLNQVVLEVLESLGPALSERGIDVRLPRPLPTVRCDRVRVAEVYRNLIGNAIKYTDKPDPRIEISWRPPPSSPDQEGAWPVLYVRDNGIGIPARHFGTVFGIFKRLHNRDDYGGGTGSGLAFVKRIIERHRGRIWIESTEGEGTTFCFTLGREEHAAAQTPHPHR